MTDPLRVLALGGPTAVLELGGLRLLTDPTFDPPGRYPSPRGHELVKTSHPAVGPGEVGRVDAVLLSHDQHDDNLDAGGRAFLARVPHVLTTVAGAGRLGGTALEGLDDVVDAFAAAGLADVLYVPERGRLVTVGA